MLINQPNPVRMGDDIVTFWCSSNSFTVLWWSSPIYSDYHATETSVNKQQGETFLNTNLYTY